jgi:hypothetical protein
MYLISSPLLWRAPIVVSASRAVLASAPETYFALLVLKTIVYGMIIVLLSAHHVSSLRQEQRSLSNKFQVGCAPRSALWLERGGTLNGVIPYGAPALRASISAIHLSIAASSSVPLIRSTGDNTITASP